MKVLTVRLPWAVAFFLRVPAIRKTIENRTWKAPDDLIGQRIAIHAARVIDQDAQVPFELTDAMLSLRGQVIGTVQLVGCHPELSSVCWQRGDNDDPWSQFSVPTWPRPPAAYAPRIWHWEIEQPHGFQTPIPARGQLGLWEPGPSIAGLIRYEQAGIPA